MRRGRLIRSILLAAALVAIAGPTAAGTFTKLNEGDPHAQWAVPRINNPGHVIMIRGITSSFSGYPYLWTGEWAGLTDYPGAYVANSTFQPTFEMNDNDRIGFRTSGEGVLVADTSGIIPLGTAPTPLNYMIDINNNDKIAAFSYVSWMNSRIYTSDDPYADYSWDVGPADIIQFHMEYNDSNQIAWKPPGTSTMYLFTPGVGNVAIDPFDWAPFDLDNRGRVLHVRDKNKIMLNNMKLRENPAIWLGNSNYSQPRISDNGKHAVWTEHDGTLWDLWYMVDGIPTNLTEGNYYDCISPDVNDDGRIVFASTQLWVSPYDSDVWLFEPTELPPTVYNGHFDGETFFGWDVALEGAAEANLVASGGGFAAELVSGSPAAIEQAIDGPSGSASLAFDFDFISANGTLTISFDGVIIGELTAADDTTAGFTHIEIPLTGALPSRIGGAMLSFSLDDASPATVWIDNIGIPSISTAVAEGAGMPSSFRLGRVYPNPITADATVQFALDRTGPVEIAVFDITGRRVAVLLDESRAAGPGRLTWDGRSARGDLLSPGVYLMRIRSGDRYDARKIHLVR